jgi:hypothetical protein
MRNRLARQSVNNRRQELRPAALLVGGAVHHRAVHHPAVNRPEVRAAVKVVPRREYRPAVPLVGLQALAGRHPRG